jgi:hypothetical protein
VGISHPCLNFTSLGECGLHAPGLRRLSAIRKRIYLLRGRTPAGFRKGGRKLTHGERRPPTKRGRGTRRVAEVPQAGRLETNKSAGGLPRCLPGGGSRVARDSSVSPGGPKLQRAAPGSQGELALGCSPAGTRCARLLTRSAPRARGSSLSDDAARTTSPRKPRGSAGRGLAQFPGIRRAGKRRGGRSGGWRAASARAGGARARVQAQAGAGPTWAGALRAREGAGRAGDGRLSERALRLAQRLRLSPGSAGGARRARRGGSGAPGGAARSARTHAAPGRPERRGHCPGPDPRPRR